MNESRLRERSIAANYLFFARIQQMCDKWELRISHKSLLLVRAVSGEGIFCHSFYGAAFYLSVLPRAS